MGHEYTEFRKVNKINARNIFINVIATAYLVTTLYIKKTDL